MVNINSEPKVKSFWEKSDHMERKINNSVNSGHCGRHHIGGGEVKARVVQVPDLYGFNGKLT